MVAREDVLEVQDVRSHRSSTPLIPMQPRRQIRQPLRERNMYPLRTARQYRRISFGIMVLENLSDHTMHDLA